ncbi:hypothetical protein [Nocardia suismassiliense]|uniref:hypothetical protein n=1 Tax=Nocardia suismassiliense TaxID=2077092 RepID=UPI000D1DE55E|nr:hypothetical protein [Nocardia suismassiliense]
MNEIEYVFGTGDGSVHVWSSAADLELARSGTADAVQLDFDGDGLADDALWDTAGSGIADVAALDLDDDGVLDHFYTDPTGLGTWNHHITGSTADAVSEPLDWIVRTDHIDARQHAVPADAGAGQPDRLCEPPGFDEQLPRTDHPATTMNEDRPAATTDELPGIDQPATTADDPPPQDNPVDLPDYLVQRMNPTGRHLDDDPTIT